MARNPAPSPKPDRTALYVAVIGAIGVIIAALVSPVIFPSRITIEVVGQTAVAEQKPTIQAQAQETFVAEQPTPVVVPPITAVTAVTVNPVVTAVTVNPVVTAVTAVTMVVPTLTPLPTETPIPLPQAFRDDFDSNLKSEWLLLQSGYTLSKGKISGSGIIIYPIIAHNFQIKTKTDSVFKIIMRAKFENNQYKNGYILTCGYGECTWSLFKDGYKGEISKQKIEGMYSGTEHELVIEINGRDLSLMENGKIIMSVSDETVQSGNVGILFTGGMDYFEFMPLP